MKRKCILFLLILALLLSCSSSFGTNSVNYQLRTVSLNGMPKKINVVSIDLTSPSISLEVVKAKDVVGGSEAFSSMIERKTPLAAINGNFFDAYKTLEPYGSILQNGKLVYLEGNNASFSVLSDKTVHMDQYQIIIKGYLDGERVNKWNSEKGKMDFNLFSIWYVNNRPTDSTGVYLYTKERGEAISVTGGNAVVVIGDKVASVLQNPTSLVVPENGYLIYYGKDAAPLSYITDRFDLGRMVSLEYEVQKKDDQILSPIIHPITELQEDSEGNLVPVVKKDFCLSTVTQMISAGPLLLRNGEFVVDSYKQSFQEAKITTNKAQRSALGVTRDNKLLFVTSSNLTVTELASVMKQLDCIYAMNLDGGASSGLYANGKMITTPGRQLNTTLMVLPQKEELTQ